MGSGHGHSHSIIDASIESSSQGIQALKWSLAGLLFTAILQVVVVILSGSVALLADTIHNLGDAATAIPLWIAFALARLKPSQRFPYGLGRVEDLAGVTVVLVILFSALVSIYMAIQRLLHPVVLEHLGWVMIASLIGFLGNEVVAVFRIRVGKKIGSAALVADGYHARVDGWTSLAVFLGAIGVKLGYPLADPVIGLVIATAILWIVWESVKSVLLHMLDGVEPELTKEARHMATHMPGVRGVGEVRLRWVGHRLHAELNISVEPGLTVSEGHAVAKDVRHHLLHHLPHLDSVTIHVDPQDLNGEFHHQIFKHSHDGLPAHSH